MQIHCETTLSPALRETLSRLINACRQVEPTSLSIPEDGQYYLWISGQDDEALACLILCPVCAARWECYAFTHPRHRRQGLFRKLYARAGILTKKETCQSGQAPVLLFLSDGLSKDAMAAMQAMQMQCLYAEYQMERSVPAADQPRQCGDSASASGMPRGDDAPRAFRSMRIVRRSFHEQGMDGWIYLAFLSPSSGARKKPCCAGTCRILSYDGSRFYLYHLEIRERFRSRGLGRRLLHAVLDSLPEGSQVILQVSSQNIPAMALYTKTGFCVTKTLSYYTKHPAG